MQTNRQGFLELLQRYIDGTSSPDEKQMMDAWYDLLNYTPDHQVSVVPDEHQEAMLWAKIQQRLLKDKNPEKTPPPTKGRQPDKP